MRPYYKFGNTAVVFSKVSLVKENERYDHISDSLVTESLNVYMDGGTCYLLPKNHTFEFLKMWDCYLESLSSLPMNVY